MLGNRDFYVNQENCWFQASSLKTVLSLLLCSYFYSELGLVCKKNYCFVEFTPVKCFKKFVQSALDARREGDENPNSSVVEETVKLIANSSYGYQIMDRSRHTVTKYLNDEKTHGAINTKLFKRFDHINDQLYEVELAKAEIEHREPIFVGFFILQYANLRLLKYTNFWEILWRQQSWGVRNGHWLFVFGYVWERVVRLHSRRI